MRCIVVINRCSVLEPHPVCVREGPLIVLTAELGVGPQGQHVDVIRDDGRGAVKILDSGPGAFDLS